MFDPTPSVIEHYNQEMMSDITQYFHAANYWLTRYLVDYNLGTQRDMINQIRRGFSQPNWTEALSWRSLAYTFGGLALAYLLFRYLRRKTKMTKVKKRPSFYIEFLKLLRQRGIDFEKESFETFSQFHQRIGNSGKINKDFVLQVDGFLQHYLYGTPDNKIEQDAMSLIQKEKQNTSKPSTESE